MSQSASEPSYRGTPRDYHHGRSPASWAGSMIAIVGFVVGAVGFLLMNWAVIWTAAGIVALALVATVALRSMGYGAPGQRNEGL